MIRTGNRAIDLAALEERVRAKAEHLLAQPMPDAAREPAERAERLRELREMLADMEGRVALAAERSAVRTALPARMRALGPLGPLALRALNYALKSERESAAELQAAMRGAIFVLRSVIQMLEP